MPKSIAAPASVSSTSAGCLDLGKISQEEAEQIQHGANREAGIGVRGQQARAVRARHQTSGGQLERVFRRSRTDRSDRHQLRSPEKACWSCSILAHSSADRLCLATRKLKRPMAQRREMAEGKRPLDWASAEAAAFASCLVDGHPIRMTGQDCQRGTFSQRHAVLHDTKNGQTYTPLQTSVPTRQRLECLQQPTQRSGRAGDSNTVTRSIAPMDWSSGKPNSVTSGTVPR